MKRTGPVLLLALVAALFLSAAWWIVESRLASGDVYPAYSTLRPDPRGTKAFFESVGKVDQVEAIRHPLPSTRLARYHDSTIFILGAARRTVQSGEMRRLEELARVGNRVVVALEPEAYTRFGREEMHADETVEQRRESLARVLSLSQLRGRRNQDGLLTAQLREEGEALPKSIEWADGSIIHGHTNYWKTIYAVGGEPVVVQRNIGLGAIVVFGDSYLFTNEALYSHRQTEVLTWTLGNNVRAVFDESHLGVQSANGVMAMIREYRLHGALLGGVVVFALWFWSATARFLPPVDSSALALTERSPSGKASHAGFTHLLQRHLPRERLLEHCAAEWKKSQLPSPSLREKCAAIDGALVEARDSKDYVTLYKRIASIVSSKQIS